MKRRLIPTCRDALATIHPIRRARPLTPILNQHRLSAAPIHARSAVGIYKGGTRWNSSLPPKPDRFEGLFNLERDAAKLIDVSDITELEPALRLVLDSIGELATQLAADPQKAEHLYRVPPAMIDQMLEVLKDPSTLLKEVDVGNQELDTHNVKKGLASTPQGDSHTLEALKTSDYTDLRSENELHEGLKHAVFDTTRLARQLQLRKTSISLGEVREVLGRLGSSLSGIGIWKQAMEVYELCVNISRAEVANRPSSTRRKDGLTRALHNLSFCLNELHRPEDALNVNGEAVKIQEGLVEEHPQAFSPGLALILGTRSLRLDDAGYTYEAIVAGEESLEIYRKLAEEDPLEFGPKVSMSLIDLSNLSYGEDRLQEGLKAGIEGTSVILQLAGKHPGQYEPRLAASLANVWVDLGNAGYEEQALLAIEKAVELYRELAQGNPMVFRPKLAAALQDLSDLLTALDRETEGLTAIDEAVNICRELANTSPEAFTINLAQSIIRFSLFLGNTGDEDEALTMIKEAVRVCQTIKQDQLPSTPLMQQLEFVSTQFEELDLEDHVRLAEMALTLSDPPESMIRVARASDNMTLPGGYYSSRILD